MLVNQNELILSAYELGGRAGSYGRPIHHCPYADGTELWRAWRVGWTETSQKPEIAREAVPDPTDKTSIVQA